MFTYIHCFFKRLLDNLNSIVYITILCRNIEFFVEKLANGSRRNLTIHVKIDFLDYCLIVQEIPISDPQLMIMLHGSILAPHEALEVRSPPKLHLNWAVLVVHSFDLNSLMHTLFLLMPLMALNLELYHLALCISLSVLFLELNFYLNTQCVISIQGFIFISELSWKMAEIHIEIWARNPCWISHNFILDFSWGNFLLFWCLMLR